MSHDPVFRSYDEAIRLSEQDTFPMGAPNKQPAKQGGMKVTPDHPPYSGAGSNSGAGEGKGGETKRGSVPKGTGKNKNVLH